LPKLFVFYHFLQPDLVVSSIQFSQLSSGLIDYGWEVTAFPGNRDSSNPALSYPSYELFHGVQYHRAWRPAWRQASSAGRMLNAVWMVARWSLLALRWHNLPEVILVGTDPILSILIAPVWRLLHPKIKIVQWCFDLYPDAAFADGVLPRDGFVANILRWLTSFGYRRCNFVVDMGSCMRRLVVNYDSHLRMATIVPWALSEPARPLPVPAGERTALFGRAALALMYSGSFGRAHAYEDMLELMRQLRGTSAHLVLSVQGNRQDSLHQAVKPQDENITFVSPASPDRLEERLAAADIHIVSLREEWTGTVVPSKFFGALAVGRPILFCGSRRSSLAEWIEKFEVGWILEPGNAAQVALQMRTLLAAPDRFQQMRERCHTAYQEHFSRHEAIQSWNKLLRNELAGEAL
jgi:colanic acid biosynthesis glycosyl transferase WcaI